MSFAARYGPWALIAGADSINSGACYSGMFGLAAYCGSKGFVLNFSQGLWA